MARVGHVLGAMCALFALCCSSEPASEPQPPAPAQNTVPASSGGAPALVPAAGMGGGGSGGATMPPPSGGAMAERDSGIVVDAGAGPQSRPDGSVPATTDAQAGEPEQACPATALAPGNHDGEVEFGGHTRTYLLHLPQGYTGETAVPLVFDFHGYGQPVSSQLNASGFADLSEQHGFAVVYPEGVGGSWHVNGCCGQAASEMLDEVGAVRAMLARIERDVCVDRKRVYASGISQGGGMAHHVGCLAADVFAAVAPVSSDLRTDPCMPARPISELSFRGTADALSAYEGGPVGPPGGQYQSIGAKATLERWRMIDQCTGPVQPVREVCETYTQCAGGVEVTLCSIPGGGHALYTNPAGFELAEFAWEMFERQRLP